MYAPYASFAHLLHALTHFLRAFTHQTDPLRSIRNPCAIFARFSAPNAPLRTLTHPFSYLSATFAHPLRLLTDLVPFLFTFSQLVSCRSRDSFENVDWSEVSRSVPVSAYAPDSHLFHHSTPGSRRGRSSSDIRVFTVRSFGLMAGVKPLFCVV